jgi:hypothetical protein
MQGLVQKFRGHFCTVCLLLVEWCSSDILVREVESTASTADSRNAGPTCVRKLNETLHKVVVESGRQFVLESKPTWWTKGGPVADSSGHLLSFLSV